MALTDRDEMVLVQNALIDLGRAGPFWKLTYDPDTQKASLVESSPGVTATVTPASVLANEVDGSFGQAERLRRHYRVDKLGWTWELHLVFNDHASLTPFERILRAGAVLIPADKPSGQRQVTVELQSVSYTHPPTQSPRTGTRANYLVSVRFRPL